MPGTYLNLDLPSLADSMATIVAKLVAALSRVQDDLTPSITPGQLNINSALSMNGASLINTGSVQLVAGNVPTLAGNFYFANGEFYAVDATGPVRLTLNGALDASSIGAISGLGGTTAAVTYDLASTQFRFTSNIGVWADLVARNAFLQGTNGSVQMGVAASIAAARIFNFGSLPASGSSLLVYNAATSTLEDAAVTAPTNNLKGPLTVVGALTTQGDYKIAAGFGVTQDLPLAPAASSGSCTVSETFVQSTAAAWSYTTPSLSHVLRVNDRLTQFTLFWRAKGAGTATITISAFDTLAGTTATLQTFTDVGTGLHSVTCGLTTPITLTSSLKYFIAISGTANADVLGRVTLLYDHP